MEKATLLTLSPEALVEGFITEVKLGDPLFGLPVEEANKHTDRWYAYSQAIAARGALPSLLPLIDSPDTRLAYCTTDRPADLDEPKDRALAALDRIADARVGTVSFMADNARNMVRYGDPGGDPVEIERNLVENRARECRFC